ncbi:helix-turn-helix domain-containing protein [Streptomyces sp. NBC_00083]|uniref:helix-turn-helix domain-containing protein n=1 Tax=Streptomyces sp. NBC_00083 TaxID=2975647 RepID=UPI00224E2F12|nr:XRE family transcriptional regulator [Streptomyces sp. NBC_00083]MCX5384680.1 XRE family transcriptional regulator [Streptomyces sp. NBC_00083]
MALADQVGRRLKELRTDQGLSLSELARRSAIGKGTLSELETGQRNPTLETLYALTRALDVPLSSVLNVDEPVRVSGAAVDATLSERFESAEAVTDVFRIRIRADATQESAAHAPGTEERIVVLSGTARVGPAGSPRLVHPGEQAHWAADVPHVYAAASENVEAVLFVRCPVPARVVP